MYYNLKVLDFGEFKQYRIYQRVVNYESEEEKEEVKGFGKEEEEEDSLYSLWSPEEKEEHSSSNSINRTVNSIYRYGLSNVWDYFVTFTLCRENKFDVYSYDVAVSKIREWFHYLRRSNPDLKYLFVPERHKDGAYHFHGLIADCPNLKLSDSGRVASGDKALKRTKKNEHLPTIYNLEQWKYGFTTATAISDTRKVVSYLCKYITKDLIDDVGKRRRFYPSNNLKVPEETEYFIESFDLEDFLDDHAADIDFVKSVTIPECGQKVTYVTVNKN